jgi:hypothetical protein
MVILGFDCSTTVAGWAFSENGKIVDAGFVDISNLTTNRDKVFLIIDTIEKRPLFPKIDHINLEAALSGFAGGFTSQQVIIMLSRFNAVFEYVITERWQKTVNLLNVNTARKKVFGKARVKGVKSKDYVQMSIPATVPNYEQFNVINKRGNVDKRMNDVWDAMVIALYG